MPHVVTSHAVHAGKLLQSAVCLNDKVVAIHHRPRSIVCDKLNMLAFSMRNCCCSLHSIQARVRVSTLNLHTQCTVMQLHPLTPFVTAETAPANSLKRLFDFSLSIFLVVAEFAAGR
jgi:hypothetical protein